MKTIAMAWDHGFPNDKRIIQIMPLKRALGKSKGGVSVAFLRNVRRSDVLLKKEYRPTAFSNHINGKVVTVLNLEMGTLEALHHCIGEYLEAYLKENRPSAS